MDSASMDTNNKLEDGDFLDKLSEETRKEVWEYIKIYLQHKAKEEKVQSLDVDDKVALFWSVAALSSVSLRLLRKAEDNSAYRHIKDLLNTSQEQGYFDPTLEQEFQVNRRDAIENIEMKGKQVFEQILGDQVQHCRDLLASDRANKEELFNKILEQRRKMKANSHLNELLGILNYELFLLTNNVSLPKHLLTPQSGDFDWQSHFAFLIYRPQFLAFGMSEVYFDEKWSEFPLKWFFMHSSVGGILTLLDMFKNGENIAAFFVQKYDDDNLEAIVKHLKDPLIVMPLRKIIKEIRLVFTEASKCYGAQLYASTTYTLLPLIEGILWEFSRYVDSTGIEIYEDKSEYSVAINKEDKKPISNLTIGTLLQNTAFGDFFDKEFISYFCDELYAERNPVLHGKEFHNLTHENAGKKIGTLEYLLDVIKEYAEEFFLGAMDKGVDPATTAALLKTLEFKWD